MATKRFSGRIFVTGMWGFEPDKDGYVGFTRESTRDKLVSELTRSDLMLVVGQRGEYSREKDIGRILGLVELEPKPIFEYERMSADRYAEKINRFGKERWQYALPIKRAWSMGREIKSKYAAPQTCTSNNARAIGSAYLMLSESDVENILNFPVLPVAVWGEPDWIVSSESSQKEIKADDAVSRGPPPSFGETTVNRFDGETTVYLMKLEGKCLDQFLPSLLPNASGKAIIKIGRSSNPERRRKELNNGFPPRSAVEWKLMQVQVFENAAAAHNAEQNILTEIENRKMSLGYEFAIIPNKEVGTILSNHSGSSAFKIVG